MIDEIATGVLVEVITATGRQLGTALAGRRGRDERDALDVVRWFDTYRLTDSNLQLPELPPDITRDEITDALNRDEFQAVLHELLAVRLTDAPETDAVQVGIAADLTLQTAFPGKNINALSNVIFRCTDLHTSRQTRGRVSKPAPADS